MLHRAATACLPCCLVGPSLRQPAFAFCVLIGLPWHVLVLQTEERLERDAAVADMVTAESAAAEEGQVCESRCPAALSYIRAPASIKGVLASPRLVGWLVSAMSMHPLHPLQAGIENGGAAAGGAPSGVHQVQDDPEFVAQMRQVGSAGPAGSAAGWGSLRRLRLAPGRPASQSDRPVQRS